MGVYSEIVGLIRTFPLLFRNLLSLQTFLMAYSEELRLLQTFLMHLILIQKSGSSSEVPEAYSEVSATPSGVLGTSRQSSIY